MKVLLSALDDTSALRILRQAGSSSGQLVESPDEADLIVLLGSFARQRERLFGNELYRRFRAKCTVYTDDDSFLPLLPGVYCSAQNSLSARVGRVSSYCYVVDAGADANRFTAAPQPDAAKTLLFSFQGGSTSILRKRLFNQPFGRDDVLIENTSSYLHWDASQPDREARQQRFAETMYGSHFALCPRGAGAGSIRFFEAMRMGVAPVLISDRYALPPGVDWDSFLVRVPERDIARLPALLEPLADSSRERGRLARAAWERHFAPDKQFAAVLEGCWKALHHGGPSEGYFAASQPAIIARYEARRRGRDLITFSALKLMRTLRIRNPYQMNKQS